MEIEELVEEKVELLVVDRLGVVDKIVVIVFCPFDLDIN